MSPRLAAAERDVINAAKRFERAAHYGVDSPHAREQFDKALVEQARARRQEAA